MAIDTYKLAQANLEASNRQMRNAEAEMEEISKRANELAQLAQDVFYSVRREEGPRNKAVIGGLEIIVNSNRETLGMDNHPISSDTVITVEYNGKKVLDVWYGGRANGMDCGPDWINMRHVNTYEPGGWEAEVRKLAKK